jgi:hypothetical protein
MMSVALSMLVNFMPGNMPVAAFPLNPTKRRTTTLLHLRFDVLLPFLDDLLKKVLRPQSGRPAGANTVHR